MKIRTYSELQGLRTVQERFRYLSLRGTVAQATFGSDRHVNQKFYTSYEWRQIRHEVIARDLGCDLGIEGYEIHQGLYIHHMNPMTLQDILNGDPAVLNPEFLITVTHQTHNAIHYGNEEQLPQVFVERRPGDTKLW